MGGRRGRSPRFTASAQAVVRALAGSRTAVAALCGMAFLVPIAVGNFTALGAGSPLLANQFDLLKLLVLQGCLGVAVAGWAWSLWREGLRVRWARVLTATIGMVALLIIGSVVSSSPVPSVLGRDPRYMGLITLVAFLLVFFLAAQVLHGAAEKRALGWSVVASGVVVAAYALLQYAGADPGDWGVRTFDAVRPSSTLGNPLPLGGFLIGSISLTVGLALEERVSATKFALWTAVLLQATALAATFTRGAWLGAIVALVVLAAVAWRRGFRPRRPDVWCFAVVALVIVLLLGLSARSANPEVNVLSRIGSLSDSGSGSVAERLDTWQVAYEAIRERPWLGWGPESFRWAYAQHRPAAVMDRLGPELLLDDANSYPLHLAVTQGVPAAVLTVVLLVMITVAAVRRPVGEPSEGTCVLEAGYVAALAGTLAYLATGLTSSVAVVFVWLYAGVLLQTRELDSRRGSPLTRVGSGVVVFVAVASLLPTIGFVRADAHFVRGRTTAVLEERLECYRDASERAPFSDVYALALGEAYTSAAQLALEQALAAQEAGQDPSVAGAAFEHYAGLAEVALDDAVRLGPDEAYNHAALARLHLLTGSVTDGSDLEEAERDIVAALELFPTSPRLHAEHARVLVARGEGSEALATAEYAVSLYRYEVTLAALGQSRLALGDASGALDAMREALEFSPGDAWLQSQVDALTSADGVGD